MAQHPSEIHISDYTYQLPEERIARYPLEERDQSKLLVYKQGQLQEDVYRNISQHLPEGSLLVFNNTRVIPARVFFYNANGGKVEVFCLEPAERMNDMASAMSRAGTTRWKCLVGRASKWKEKVLTLRHAELELSAELVDRDADNFIIEFRWAPEALTFAEVLEKAGAMPIPPYLKRESDVSDRQRYQTIYAKYDGSVAAPTAGLHFTPAVMERLAQKHIGTTEVTLHVGAGTFKPVKSETLGGHQMHAELTDVSVSTIQQLIEQLKTCKGPVVAVGTTSLRTIESLYWFGVKVHQRPAATLEELAVSQWDPYQLVTALSAEEALSEALKWLQRTGNERLLVPTQILIAPPYRLKVAQALVTNFHQPNSTLLLLVAATVGEDWKKLYDYALANDFRFLSYGDGSLLFAQ
ncbi:MAG: S-adenosylmethionine:tRNA ribosyltransferase-isomerase [Chitinophagales bacterium]